MHKHSAPGLVDDDRPLPTDFDKFLPWACAQQAVNANVVITRTVLSEYVSVIASERMKFKGKPKVMKPPSDEDLRSQSIDDVKPDSLALVSSKLKHEKVINIQTIYDTCHNLIHIKFRNNKPIPRMIMKIIGLIIEFHPTVTTLSINSGLQKEAMYEISKFLPLSKITEICLDNTYIGEANYHVLLDHSGLKHLSVSKCKITDDVLKTISNKLIHPSPAAKTLCALNLATNRITDVGVKYLADMLRTNRHLYYLNLADNLITDQGAIYILDILGEFPLDAAEVANKRVRYMAYLKEKRELVAKAVKELRAGEFDKRTTKRKSIKPLVTVTMRKSHKDPLGEGSKSLPNLDAIFYERAEILVENTLGPFRDPFSPNDTFIRDGSVFCYGNNTLSYLNMAYNNLTYFSIKKLYEIILTQKYLDRRPKGLVNVVIEGNFLPQYCGEFEEIDDLLGASFPIIARRSIIAKKRSSLSVARSFS